MRDYDPTTGRYLQADPLGLVDGASVYGYGRQNPGRWIDPTGRFTEGALGVCALGGPFNPICDGAVVVNVCKWVAIGAIAYLATTDEACGCAEDREQLSAQIETLAQSLQFRLEDMIFDQHDLFNTAPTNADNWGKGSWKGHQNKYESERETLQDLIALADSKGCPVSQFARDMASEGAPDRPFQ